jgi:hypothetical protein
MGHVGGRDEVAAEASAGTGTASLVLASIAGAAAAIACDSLLRGEASSIFRVNEWLVGLSRMSSAGDLPLWSAVLMLLAAGAATSLLMRPSSQPTAFAKGFGIVAALMMAAPPNVGGGLQGLDANPGSAENYQLVLSVHFPNGLRDDLRNMSRHAAIRGKLYDEGTGETYNLFRTVGSDLSMSDETLVVRASVPAKSGDANLWVRIETAGYAIEEQSAEARAGEMLEWRIDMRPSATPLVWQRLGKSYWF